MDVSSLIQHCRLEPYTNLGICHGSYDNFWTGAVLIFPDNLFYISVTRDIFALSYPAM